MQTKRDMQATAKQKSKRAGQCASDEHSKIPCSTESDGQADGRMDGRRACFPSIINEVDLVLGDRPRVGPQSDGCHPLQVIACSSQWRSADVGSRRCLSTMCRDVHDCAMAFGACLRVFLEGLTVCQTSANDGVFLELINQVHIGMDEAPGILPTRPTLITMD